MLRVCECLHLTHIEGGWGGWRRAGGELKACLFWIREEARPRPGSSLGPILTQLGCASPWASLSSLTVTTFLWSRCRPRGPDEGKAMGHQGCLYLSPGAHLQRLGSLSFRPNFGPFCVLPVLSFT